ncbi:MAG TPA: hypothetical protein DEB46_03790 [Myxococcales bacterium]|nr:hypothetical protein [Myxococcales bacterium]HBU47412.1 hypothetical protein [Myxococcales bacterium]
MLPRVDGLPGAQDCDLKGFLRQLKQEAPLIFRVGFYLSAWVLVLTPILTVFRPLPAFLLSKSKLDAHVMNLSQSRFYGLRQSLLMVKTVAGMCWGADPNVREALGLEPYGKDPGSWRTD